MRVPTHTSTPVFRNNCSGYQMFTNETRAWSQEVSRYCICNILLHKRMLQFLAVMEWVISYRKQSK